MRCHRRRRASKAGEAGRDRRQLGPWPELARTPQAGRNPLSPFGLRAAWGHLRRCHSSTMAPHRLRRGALHLAPWRSQRDRPDFYHGLLAKLRLKPTSGGFE